MHSDEVVAAAALRAGVDAGDVTTGTPSWQEPLAVLVESLNSEARLTVVGGMILGDQLVKPLANRFTVDTWHAAHPAVRNRLRLNAQPPHPADGLCVVMA